MPRRIRRKRNYSWSALVLTGTANVSTTTAFATLVDGDDWARVGSTVSLEKGAILRRIRGYLTFAADIVRSEDTDWVYSTVRMAIYRNTAEGQATLAATPPDLDLASFYVTHDILWTFGMGYGGAQNTEAELSAHPGITYPVDIPVNRKLDSQTVIVLALQADQVAGYGKRVAGVLRCLIETP